MPSCTCLLKTICRHARAAAAASTPEPIIDAPAVADLSRELQSEQRGPGKRTRRRAVAAMLAAAVSAGAVPPSEPAQPPTARVAPTRQPSTPWGKRALEENQERASAMLTLRAQVAAAASDADKREKVLRQIRAKLARRSFASYCQQAWHVVEPTTKLQWGRHHQLVADTLQGLFEDWLRTKREAGYVNAIRNACFNLPPGSLKSRIIAVFFPTWAWLHEPGWRVICLSVNEKAAHRDARAARDLVKSDWYQISFEPAWKLKDDQDAISDYGNTMNGGRLSQAAGSEIVGLRGDCVLIDDANNPLDSENKTERDQVNERWSTNTYNRVNDELRSLRIGVQQRTNSLDWTGFVLKTQGVWSPENPDGWLHVVLPAEYERARKFIAPESVRGPWTIEAEDWRTVEGETLDPDRMPPALLARTRDRWRGTSKYAGQMQQSPTDAGGGSLKARYFGWFRVERGVRDEIDEIMPDPAGGRPRPADCNVPDAAPKPIVVVGAQQWSPGDFDFDWICITVDPANKKTETGSNWGILVMAGKGQRYFVLDDRTQLGGTLEITDLLKELIVLWKPDKILIELKAAGPALIEGLEHMMDEDDCPITVIEGVEPGGQGKEKRLDGCIRVFASGRVFLLEGADWLEELVSECVLFPNGDRDDRVDALTQAINHMRALDDEYPLD